jgi:ribonuclease-3
MIFYITEVQEKIGYIFKDPELLRQCFTHPSYLNGRDEKNYERYEFLGDSVLGFVVSDFVFKKTYKDEGEMTEEKKKIASSKPLSYATSKLGVEKYMLKSDSLKITDSMRENLFESIIGGIYLDGGYENAKRFVLKNLIPAFEESEKLQTIDYKSALNEYSQKYKLGAIKYTLLSKEGKDHIPSFKMSVSVDGNELAIEIAGSKKQAEQNCAKTALAKLKKRKKK